MSSDATHVDQLRVWRVRPSRTKSINDLMPGMQRQFRRTERQVGAFANAWNECVPPELRDQCRVETVRGGRARVTAGSSAIAFQLDRALRSGLLRTLRATCSIAITRVDVRVGTVRTQQD
jgi:hypothetical protein